uniref:Protein krueppel n=1 Tax=Anopheles farauti TaxID=69004 RepID=A0A182QIR4_9DIPT
MAQICNICRFCLNQGDHNLYFIPNIINDMLTIHDIELFTGIQLVSEESIPYAVCADCYHHLKTAVAFRNLCVRNDTYFRENFLLHVEVLKDDGTDTILPGSNHFEEKFEFEDECTEEFLEDAIELTYDEDSMPDDNELAHNVIVSNKDEQSGKTIPIKTCNSKLEKNVGASIKTHSSSPSKGSLPTQSKRFERTKLEYGLRKQCEICGSLVTDLRRHLRCHKDEIQYVCTYCGIRMSDNGNLLRHIQAVHLKKVIKSCEICNKNFTVIASYVSHMRSQHDIGKTHDCNICSKKFNHRSGLREHIIRLHTDERKFKCSTCGSQWKTQRTLQVHERVHSSEQPYACSQCPKRFKSPYGRKTHELTHSGIVFKCKMCDKSYRYKALLNAHNKKHHPEEYTKSDNEHS